MKALIKFFIYLCGYLLHHNRRSKLFYYHDVDTNYTDMGTPRSLLESHIAKIRKCGFEIVKEISSPNNQIMIAFDDGWKGLYDNKDYFLASGIFPTVFIAVDLIGQEGYMTAEQITELSDLGFCFECHTWTHTGLPDHHGESLKHELQDAREELERRFGKPFTAICFPQGRYSNEVIEGCKAAGFEKMYSSVCGGYYDEYEHHIIRRNLMQAVPVSQVKLILEGDTPLLRNRDLKHHKSDYGIN